MVWSPHTELEHRLAADVERFEEENVRLRALVYRNVNAAMGGEITPGHALAQIAAGLDMPQAKEGRHGDRDPYQGGHETMARAGEADVTTFDETRRVDWRTMSLKLADALAGMLDDGGPGAREWAEKMLFRVAEMRHNEARTTPSEREGEL